MKIICLVLSILFPSVSWAIDYDQCIKNIRSNTAAYATKYSIEHNLEHLHTGFCTGNEGRCLSLCSFYLCSDQPFSLDEARLLAKDCITGYVCFIKNVPDTKVYLENCYEGCSSLPRGFQVDYVGVRIGFWTKNVDRMSAPYIAEMRFFNKTYHYYQADPKTQALVEVFQEPYEETSSSTLAIMK